MQSQKWWNDLCSFPSQMEITVFPNTVSQISITVILVHFSSLILKVLMFTLAIFCLTTSNLPWFMDLTFLVPMQHCSLQQWTLLFTTSHIHNWALWLSLFMPSRAISPLFSSSILDTYQPRGFVFQHHIFLSFHILEAKWSHIINSQGKVTKYL